MTATKTISVESARNVVLVHGAFVDGSTWQGVYDLLKQDGYNVAVVQNPTQSLKGDVAATRQVIDAQDGPVVLVGHSYGGAVITEAGTDPKVAALVYIAAFAPDEGESVNSLVAKAAPDAKLQTKDGFVLQDREKFPTSFGGDLRPEHAAFLADSQIPWGVDAGNALITKPAWRDKPSWYLIATEDKMIPPSSQRAMSKRAGSTVDEVRASHAVYISKPAPVAAIIEQAASAVAAR
jgi:pimeloyl-ACP methyl ester carboxylesterase